MERCGDKEIRPFKNTCNTQTYSKCPLFRGAGCCQQVRVSLVVAETMVLFAFVSGCGGSSRLVNFLTIKVFKFYFMFDLNFDFV